jgi:hypothetical protein
MYPSAMDGSEWFPSLSGRFASGAHQTRMNGPRVRPDAVKRKAFDLVDNRTDIPALFSSHHVSISTKLYWLHTEPFPIKFLVSISSETGSI